MAANQEQKTNTQEEFSIRSAYERENRRPGAANTDSFASGASLLNEVQPAASKAASGSKSGKFAVGDKVNHKVFGEGTVVAVTPVAGDMLVEVQFAAATKKMMANYAPLTKVE